jgi:CHAT domain-containing protein
MVLSLWDVPDRPGSEWVERFYTHYTTSGCAAIAHRITCTETLSVRRSLGRSTHPLYWGGFVVIGAVD